MFREKIPIGGIAVTFKDVVLVPGKASVDPIEVDVRTKVTRNIGINIPLVSSPMDTVTEHNLAIALARVGGVGVIHRNLSVEEQVEMVMRVKEAPPYPLTGVYVTPSQSTNEALRVLRGYNVDTAPVVDGSKVVGMVRRSRLISNLGRVADVMERQVTADLTTSPEVLRELMRKSSVDTVAIVDQAGNYVGTATYYDLLDETLKPALDNEGRLLVGAGISPFDIERAVKLSRYADFLVTDVAHIDNEKALSALRRLVREVSVDVVVGNLGTYEGAVDVITTVEKVDGFRVGIASGSICSTGVVTGVAAPTLWAVAQVADAALDYGLKDVPVIADGGIREPGDVVKAMALGAWAAMLGRVFAQTDESPSPVIRVGNRRYKYYRGMASEGARARRFAIDRYGVKVKNIEEGVEGLVPYRGSLVDVVREFVGGIQAAMGYIGASNVSEARVKGRIMLVTGLGRQEIEPHDIQLE